ncbi:methyltransferase domain-containing protein [Caballeronia sp. LZ062]|uniref:methyltransferase domain-containing protein n=1 Tax=unclassified Caballeronia TaxID=2646786 RepID=UPI00285A4028|nr:MULTISPECIES: methyltransferase domain-containing protein [unclassified Caballeronia]MDR5855202.1 methyltransferase domain-containing protein [Caballeronia sp. LZ050]MDR5870268.1 methyltransferase domain-containing protein [Caballeronia sp. LZ062]
MERLSLFERTAPYSALEASIHMARYLSAREACKDANVLDIACGEGYGSWLMRQWGAASVLGIDVSEDAVRRAQARFVDPAVSYHAAPAESLQAIVGDKRFDLIVSLETIEHLDDPRAFLVNLKAVAAPNATIIISAPNDHWYFKDGGTNPYHKHRFTREEFQQIAEDVLGPAASWHLGTLAVGFGMFDEAGALGVARHDDTQDRMLKYVDLAPGIFVPMQEDVAPVPDQTSYYVGVWGPAKIGAALFAGYPVSMDMGRQELFPGDAVWGGRLRPEQTRANMVAQFRASLEVAENSRAQLQQQLEVAEDSRAQLEARLHFCEHDNEALRVAVRAAKAENQLVWDAIARHEEQNRILQEAIEAREHAGAALSQTIAARDHQLQEAHQRLAAVPWRIVRIWLAIRRVVPKPVLRLIGAMLAKERR